MLWKIYQLACFVVASEFFYRPGEINTPLAIGFLAYIFTIFMTLLVWWALSPFLWVRGVIDRGRQIRESEEKAERIARAYRHGVLP